MKDHQTTQPATASESVFTLVIKKPTDFIQVRNTTTLIYGQPGVGKTSYACTSPNPILFDFDEGMERVDEDYRCQFIPAEYLLDWSSVERQLTHSMLEPFDTFVFDSVTKLLDYMSDFAMRKDLKNKKNGGGLSLQGYGALGDIFKSFLAKLQMMKKNIVFVAHDKESKEGDSTRLRPDIIGGSLGLVTRSADMIGYMEMINNERVVQFTPTDRFYAKNSCGIEPQFSTSKYTLTEVIERYKTGVNAKSSENKMYKSAMKDGLGFLQGVDNVEKLNEAYIKITQLSHAMTSKVELFGAYKEYADTIDCYFDKQKKSFEEFDKAELVLEETNAPAEEPAEQSETIKQPAEEPQAIIANELDVPFAEPEQEIEEYTIAESITELSSEKKTTKRYGKN